MIDVDQKGPLSFRALAAAVAALPYAWLAPLGALLGWLAATFVRIRRRHAEAAIARAGLADPSRVARDVYLSLGKGVVELLWSAGSARSLDDVVSIDPACAEALDRAMKRGRGVVVATAHTGNWDLCACGAAAWVRARYGKTLTVVTKRLSWRALDRYWQRLRADRGVALVPAEGATNAVKAALAAGGLAVLLVDQAPERSGAVTRAPFLGAPAWHDLGPAILASRNKAPLVAIFGAREADGRHVLHLGAAIEPEALRGKRAIVEATTRIADALDAFVRARPSQWLWLHRRWKSPLPGDRLNLDPKHEGAALGEARDSAAIEP